MRRKLEVTFLWSGGLCLLVVLLRWFALSGWLGPVPARSLERGLDTGALFYAEIDIDTHRDRPYDGSALWTGDFRSWFSCLAFLSIGLGSNFRELGH